MGQAERLIAGEDPDPIPIRVESDHLAVPGAGYDPTAIDGRGDDLRVEQAEILVGGQ